MSSAFGQRIAYLKKYSKVKFSFLHHELLSHCSDIAAQRGLHQECVFGRWLCCVFARATPSHLY